MLVRPGTFLSTQQQAAFRQAYEQTLAERQHTAEELQQKSPLQWMVEQFPDNLVAAAQDNRQMLKVILATLLLGIAFTTVESERTAPIRQLLSALFAVLLAAVRLIMRFAPVGVFALMAALPMEWSLLSALGMYSLSVLGGLGLILALFYPLVVRVLGKFRVRDFYRALLPVHLVAFSTSSSAATLPATLEACCTRLGVRPELASFVLPLGATINMDGTSLYQAVATVFLAQLYGIELAFPQLVLLIVLAVAASIGAAPVPGASIVMLIVMLQNLGIPQEGVALILAVDRLLDMSRTVVNVTGDATACVVLSAWDRAQHRAS
ncbi:Proton/glutamate-aspartate symporter [bacterium HR21]|jgi:Na+/H+-dicarboxylate symporter|nr:Proton/glutamate-aspartate symporter [bacterium HR21]